MSVQVSYKKQFTFAVTLLLIFLIVVEGGARLYEWFYPNCSFVNSEALKNTSIFQQREICLDMRDLDIVENRDNRFYPENQHSDSVNINNFGFRGFDILKEKDLNMYRIFIVGGSTIFGSGSTSDKSTIPGYLQEMFVNDSLNFNVQIINAGISGANSFTEVQYIENKLTQFEPDMIVVYDGWNDSWHRDRIISNSEEKNGNNTENNFAIDTGIIDFLQNKIKIYRTPLVIYNNIFYDKDWRYDSPPANYGKSISETAYLWEENWSNLCLTKNDFLTVIALQPILGTGNKPYSNEELEILPKSKKDIETVMILNGMDDSLKNLNNFCTATMDLRNIFDGVNDPIYFDKGHMSDLGNKIIASKLYENILPIILEDISN
jgi:lysophospholipase L1-like esterase